MNLKNIRLTTGKSQLQVAKELNISQQNFCRYENGQNEPDITTLKKIADYFDVSLDYLCGRPRPYDIPGTTTEEQKQAINLILQLNNINTIKAISYCAGLLAGQE